MPIEPYEPAHSEGIAALCRDLRWPTYSDAEVVNRGCLAPGVIVRVALDDDGRVIGFAQAIGDGVMQSFLSQLGVAPRHRRKGLARALVLAAFEATGTERMDLATDDAQAFYESFPHKTKSGFRIYPK
ncbi:MAG: GNAT family N-acetyltransferase [Gammaproteobacteria bacterium]